MPSEFSVINVMTINNWEIIMAARLRHHTGAQGARLLPPPGHTGVLPAPPLGTLGPSKAQLQ